MRLLADYVSDEEIIGTPNYNRLRKACLDFEQKFGVTLWIVVQDGIHTPFALTHLKGKALESYLSEYPKEQKQTVIDGSES